MAKPMYVWSGTAWVSVASEVESLATYATQSYADNQPGMKLIVPSSVAVGSGSGSVATQGTVSFSGASSVSLNGCFSSTYTNYLVLCDITNTSGEGVYFRYRVSGSDNTTSNYFYQSFTAASTTLTGARSSSQTNALVGSAFTDTSSFNMTLFSPFASTVKSGLVFGTYRANSSGIQFNDMRFGFNATTSFTGFTIYTGAGTNSGTISVYGYKAG